MLEMSKISSRRKTVAAFLIYLNSLAIEGSPDPKKKRSWRKIVSQ